MPTQTLTTSTDLALALRTTYTTPLLTKVASGSKIYASDILMLQTFANIVLAHTHDYTEFTEVHDYGNTSANISVTGITSTPVGVSSVVFVDLVDAGQKVRASTYTALRTQTNNLLSHSHTFEDTYT